MESSTEQTELGVIVLSEKNSNSENQILRVCLQMKNLYLNVMEGVKVEKEPEERRKSS